MIGGKKMSKNPLLKIFVILAILTSFVSAQDRSEFYEQPNYKGAFGQSNWLTGWTALDHYQYLTPSAESKAVIDVFDNSINAGETVYWTADNTYVLNGFVYVEEGAVLIIEAGTVVKAKPGQGESA